MEPSRGLFEVRFAVQGRGVTRRYVCEWVEGRSWEKLGWGRSGKKEREDSRPGLWEITVWNTRQKRNQQTY